MRAKALHLSRTFRCNIPLLRTSIFISYFPFPVPTWFPIREFLSPISCRFYSSGAYLSRHSNDSRKKILLSTKKPLHAHFNSEELLPIISNIATKILALNDLKDVSSVLDSGGAATLLEQGTCGAAFIELLDRIKYRPLLALEVFDWRRKQGDSEAHSVHSEEYAKAITLAGRARNVGFAAKLFDEAARDGVKTTSIYNALMAAYMYNGITKKSITLFENLKKNDICEPTIVTYNILLSIFGRSVLVDHMETILGVIKESKLVLNISTYNTLIAGYLTAWMWDKMENTFNEMKGGPVEPNISTYLLMLRGFAHSGNLEKMESIYELVKKQVNNQEATLLRAMICAYCKSSDPERVRKIEGLIVHIPQEDYRPWLNVLLIRLYAKEGLLDKMENLILEALNRNTVVTTSSIMRSIITNYFQHDAVDQLSEFVKMAESAGWKLCRSLYHCKMVMYARQHRLDEMQQVLTEMVYFKFQPSQKTYAILYTAYSSNGKKTEADKIIGLMWKQGFRVSMMDTL